MCWSDIICWNAGRGEATIAFFNDYRIAQIIDFGTNPPLGKKVYKAISDATYTLRSCDVIDAVITHFHYDHYSLIPHILKSKSIRATYIPPIPRPKSVMKALLYLIATQAELLLMKGIVSLDEIAKRSRKVYFVYRGVKIPLDHRGLYMRILWPPLELPPDIAERAMEKLRPAYEKAKGLVEKAEIESKVERRFRELYEAVSTTLGETGERYKANEESEPIKAGEEVSCGLPTITREVVEAVRKEQYFSQEELEFLSQFRDAVNDLSLVQKHYYRDMSLTLIPGDNSGNILDLLSRLEKNEPKIHKYVAFMRGSHHGTYFGGYLEKHKALVTWLSWTSMLKQPPHPSYIKTSSLTLTAEQTNRLHIHMNNCFHLFPISVIYIRRWHLYSAGALMDVEIEL